MFRETVVFVLKDDGLCTNNGDGVSTGGLKTVESTAGCDTAVY